MVKFSAYADYLTLTVREKKDQEGMIEISREFQDIAGLKVNQEKTEVLKLGEAELAEKDFIKVTGRVHSRINDKIERDRRNFDGQLAKMKNEKKLTT